MVLQSCEKEDGYSGTEDDSEEDDDDHEPGILYIFQIIRSIKSIIVI